MLRRESYSHSGYTLLKNLLLPPIFEFDNVRTIEILLEYGAEEVSLKVRVLWKSADCYYEYHRACSREMEKMKETKFYISVWVLRIWLGNKQVGRGYSKNGESVEAFDKKAYDNPVSNILYLVEQQVCC